MSKSTTIFGVYIFLLSLVASHAMAIGTVPIPDYWARSTVPTSEMSINKASDRHEVHIPVQLLQGKSVEGIYGSIENAINLLLSVSKTNRPAWASSESISRLSQDTQKAVATLASGQLISSCPDLIIGLIPSASRAIEYKSDDFYGTTIFWPTSVALPGTVPYETYTGDWSGASGAYFYGKARSNNGYISAGYGAEVFQYKLPALSCRSVVAWYAEATAKAVKDWETSGFMAVINSDWIYGVNGSGTETPSFSLYSVINDGLWQYHYNGITHPAIKSDVTDIESDFYASAYVEPAIFLGFKLNLMALNGLASTFPRGIGDKYSFPDGVLYLRVPVE